MTDTTTNNRDRARDAMKGGDVQEWMRIQDEYQTAVLDAVRRGIDSFEARGGRKLSVLERAGVSTEVDRVCDYLEEMDAPDALILRFAEEWAESVAGDPLRTKFAVAYNIELDLTDGNPVGDGVLGSAMDESIERALPYAKRAAGWYRSTIG